jgi:hypothetical protein
MERFRESITESQDMQSKIKKMGKVRVKRRIINVNRSESANPGATPSLNNKSLIHVESI